MGSMRQAWLSPVLLLGSCLFAVALLSQSQVEARDVSGLSQGAKRSILQEISAEEEKALQEEEEFEREQSALREFSQVQAEQEGEKTRLLDAASEQALELVKKYWKAKGAKRTKLFTDLWKSGEGLVIRLIFTILAESEDLEEANGVVIDAMEVAEAEGYNIKIAEAVSNAITVVAEDGDADPFVDMLVIRMNLLNKVSEGSGCDFINFLFADVESFAISVSREFNIILAIDDEKYSELVECYYDECKREAAECCFDEKAIQQGSCQCGKGKQSRVCGFNLYHKMPRTIWVCNTDQCFEGQKCLCPTELKKVQVKEKQSGDKQTANKGEQQVAEEEEKPQKKGRKGKKEKKGRKKNGNKKGKRT